MQVLDPEVGLEPTGGHDLPWSGEIHPEPVRSASGAPADLGDAEFGRVLALGAALGLPAMFAISLLICLLAGVVLPGAAVIAAWGAVVGGPFFGGLFVLTKVLARFEVAPQGASSALGMPLLVTPGSLVLAPPVAH